MTGGGVGQGIKRSFDGVTLLEKRVQLTSILLISKHFLELSQDFLNLTQ